MSSLIIKGGVILTQDRKRRTLRGDVLIEDGIITALGGELGANADDVIDATDDIIMPGLVNAHTHAAMTLLRGLGDDLPLEEWLQTRIWPAEAQLKRADVDAGVGLALLEMIRNGTTAFNDMYFHADATAEAAAAAGVRAWAGTPFLDFDTPEMAHEKQEEFARGFVKRWQGHALVRPALAPHATYTCGDETLATVARLQKETGAPVHTHCSETRREVQEVLAQRGARPVAVLHRHGLLEGSVLAHCGWVTKEEVRTLAQAGAHAAHCPVSNMKLATGGTMPLEEMLTAGVNVALGTDGAASNNTLDMFETAKFAALIQKQHRWDARAGDAHRILDMATLGGARAMRLPAEGLAVGAPADLIVVSTREPHMAPLPDPVSALVYCARGTDVRATIVAGRVLYLDGAWRTMDAPRARKAAVASAARLVR